MPMLLRVTPRLVTPVAEGDYFAHEQVATWGIDSFWGLPENPRTPYYRTFETPVTSSAHLYEFVVPMVPPTWDDRTRVRLYAQALEGSLPLPLRSARSTSASQRWLMTAASITSTGHRVTSSSTGTTSWKQPRRQNARCSFSGS